MTHATGCKAGDWVEVERVLLEPSERQSGLPPETAEKPLIAWSKGFALTDASMGDVLSIETMTGRVVTGTLSALNPGYFHTFGNPIPELSPVGRDCRKRVEAYRAEVG